MRTELLPLIKPYYLVLLASLPFVCLFNVFKQFADGITDTALSMWVLIGGNILNIFGNWVLIYGQLGAPELGLTGAGLSTLASRVVMAVAMMVVFFSRRKYRAYAQGFLRGRINRADFRQLNLLGWPIALQMGMETSAFSLTSIIVGWIGTTALAAHQVMLTISQVGFMVYYGIGAAAAVRISNAMGQRDYRAARGNAYAAFQIVMYQCHFCSRFSHQHTLVKISEQYLLSFPRIIIYFTAFNVVIPLAGFIQQFHGIGQIESRVVTILGHHRTGPAGIW